MSPTSPLPSLLFIHGANHNSKVWSSLRSALATSGYSTHAVDLPSVGLRTNPPKDHLEDVAVVQETLKKLIVTEGQDVILIAHSYGGVPGSCAVEGFEPGKPHENGNGVRAVVFVDAILAREGMSARQACAESGGGIPAEYVREVNESYNEIVNPHAVFYADATLEESQSLIDDLRPQASAAMNSKVIYEAWRHVPVSYVSCTNSVAIPVATQRHMIEEVRKVSKFPVTVHEILACHTPMLKFENELAGFIKEAAEKGVKG